MANQEQLELLKSGVANWNKWREENPDESIDLVEVDLRKSDLISAELSKADLHGALLKGADLREANLSSTDLSWADLMEANLNMADLKGANLNMALLSRANLSGTNLNKAMLREAVLSEAILRGADLNEVDLYGATLKGSILIGTKLTEAKFGNTYFEYTTLSNVDLSNASGLDTCVHYGNSYIDYNTLLRSRNLPLSFLRSCGLSDKYIKGYQELMGEDMYFKCFISYSTNDKEFTEQLYADLQDNGVRTWYAPEDMKIAAKIRPALHEAIEQNNKLLIILSKDSMKSDWVEDEVEKAFELERKRGEIVLIPIRVDDSIFETQAGWADSIKNTRNIGDFRNWNDQKTYKKNFNKLVKGLRIEPNTNS